MKTAQKIMKRKAFIKAEMDKMISKDQSDQLWQKAEERLSAILDRYNAAPKGVHLHTDNYIFPSAAIYLSLKDAIGQETAYTVVENSAIAHTVPIGEKLAKLMKLPGIGRIEEFRKKYPEPGIKAAAEWLKTVVAWRRRFDIEIDFD